MMLPLGSRAFVLLCVVRRLPLAPIAIAIVFATPTTLRAQMSYALVGSRVRVTVVGQPDAPLVGTAIGSSEGTLYMRRSGSSDTISIQQSRIQRVEISNGSRGHFLVGMLVGGAAGAGLLAAASSGSDHSGGFGGSANWAPEGAIVGGVGGFLIGGVVGELIRTERWKSITPTVAWRSTPGQSTKTLALGVQVPW
jgi:hypothetical protein